MVAPRRREGGWGAATGGWVDLCGGEVGEVAVLSSCEQQEGQLRARRGSRFDQDTYTALCQTNFAFVLFEQLIQHILEDVLGLALTVVALDATVLVCVFVFAVVVVVDVVVLVVVLAVVVLMGVLRAEVDNCVVEGSET